MLGNSHVQFSGGWARATASGYPSIGIAEYFAGIVSDENSFKRHLQNENGNACRLESWLIEEES